MSRTFLGKPLRDISIHCNQYPITLEDFTRKVAEGVGDFKENMNHLNHPDDEEEYTEKWMEMFLAWYEIEQEKKGEDI